LVSDRLVHGRHEGNIHSDHIIDNLMRLSDLVVRTIGEIA
jgi:hypothetical protein